MPNKPIIDEQLATLHFEQYLNLTLKSYRDRVREFYHKEYEIKPHVFSFMNPTKLIVIFSNYEYTNIFSISNSEKDELEIDFGIFDNWDDFNLNKNMPDHVQRSHILEKYHIEETQLIKVDKISYGFDIEHPDFFFHDPHIIESAQKIADSDYLGYEFESVIADLFVPRDVFEEYDTEKLISLVNDDNFEYEYNEAIRAFECRLYLACISMSGVALETLLKISLERNGIKYNQKDMLGKLIDTATQHRLIRRREAASLVNFKELRNAGAHGNTGQFTKTDAEFNLRKLFEIGNILFE